MTRTASRRLAVVTLAAVAALGATSWAQAQTGTKSIGITAIVDHPALDSVRKGVQDELKALGWEEGKNLKLSYQSAQGNTATAGQIARKFAGDKVDAIVAIATPSAQAAVAASKTIPVVFTAVTDPVAAKLVKDWKASGTNVTGVSDALPLAAQMDLLLKVKPGAKRVGYVFSPGEVNSTIVLKELKTELQKRGMSVVEAAAPRTVDIPSAAKSLVGKDDVIYTTTDNNGVSPYLTLDRAHEEAKLPLVAADTDSVKRGATAALGMNYYDLGRQTGKVVDRILKGTAPGAIAPEVGAKMSLVVNPGAAEKQGITLSEALIKEAADVVK